MTGHGAKFRRRKEAAIAALLSHRSVDDAASAINVAPKTLHRWLQLPEFQAEFRKARRNVFSQSVARLQQASSAAVSTLLKVMVDANSPASSRVRAAETVLSQAAKAIELEDIEARVMELERSAQSLKSGGSRS